MTPDARNTCVIIVTYQPGPLDALTSALAAQTDAIFVVDNGSESPPRSCGGKMQVLRLLNDVQTLPRLQSAPYTSVSDLIEHALRTIRRRSVVFLVSDFFTAPGWERSLGMLSRKHEVIAVRLEDPRERELPDIGMVVMNDAETGESLHVDTHDAKFRRRFAAVVEKREAELRSAFARCGVDVLTLSTEEDLVEAVLRFAMLRKQRRGMRAAVAV